VSGNSQQLLRTTFEEVPELYDRARPNYPPEVFDDLAALAQLPAAARIVEIGCGTGQATLPLAERGCQITCVELGEQLADLARRKLTRFPNVEVINANFEIWQPPHADFDAAVSTEHVLPSDGDRFFVDVQEDYEAVVPDDPSTKAGAGGPSAPDTVADLSDEISASGSFRNVGARRYLWNVVYTVDEYIGVLNTYSGHRALDDDTRERLLSRIRQRIEARPSRQVRKAYLAMLNVAELL
jgi:SAM-dependent methyltransferase